MDTQDRIEREITIAAPLERVWSLVSEPGWWIGDGDDAAALRRRQDGDVVVVEHPKYGSFPLRTERVEPLRHVAYRWMSGNGESHADSTLVEFWLSEHDGGTLLRVAESGFAALPVDEDERARRIAGNTEGWTRQLRAGKERVERPAA